MRLFLLCGALLGLACESSDPAREIVEISQSGDPSRADEGDAAAPAPSRPSDAGGRALGGGAGRSGGGRPAPWVMDDASVGIDVPDAAATSAASDAGTSSPYRCERSLDCVIKDVGSCCGYYPRCANVADVFPAPSCAGGQVGVCGFPNIDSCECRQNRCISLQAGQQL